MTLGTMRPAPIANNPQSIPSPQSPLNLDRTPLIPEPYVLFRTSSSWNPRKNQKAISKLEGMAGIKGGVKERDFVRDFDENMPKDMNEFKDISNDFMKARPPLHTSLAPYTPP